MITNCEMYVELAAGERQMLVELLESRVGQLRPQIRRSREFVYRATLKDERDALGQLLRRLKRTRDLGPRY